MKTSFIFKTLLDILFIFLCFGVLGIFVNFLFGDVRINQTDMPIKKWSFMMWGILITTLIAYIFFLRGVYFLRKIGRELLGDRYFSLKLIKYLNISGTQFILSGILFFIISFLMIFYNLSLGELKLTYNSSSVSPFFIIIIGLFFRIQGETLAKAKTYKEEIDLTV